MGKGDKKTKRGKIIIGSYGVRRRKKKNVAIVVKKKPEAKIKEEKKVKPVEPVVEVQATLVAEEKATKKTTAKKTTAKKVTAVKEPKEEKPKAAKSKKKAASAGESNPVLPDEPKQE